MKEAVFQRKGNALIPFSEEDKAALHEFHENQPIRAKLTGTQKPRSYEQLKLYWACCKTVAGNLDDMTKEDVDFAVKVELKHIKAFRTVNGATMIEVDSVSYARLSHLKACNFFDRAFPLMARMIGVTTDELLSNAQK